MTIFSKYLRHLADNQRADSLSTSLRKKRFDLFEAFVDGYCSSNPPCPLKIIDVGGTPVLWDKASLFDRKPLTDLKVEVTVTNIKAFQAKYSHVKCIVCDAKDMRQFKDKEFDIVFSNSLIEHVGKYQEQLMVANEIRRIGRLYFVQTPYVYFPIEPHFLFPFFQFMPRMLQVWLLTNFKLGRGKIKSKAKAIENIESVQLLNKKRLLALFPDSILYEEKFCGLTKSLIAYSRGVRVS